MSAGFQLYKDAKGEFRWRLTASNGQTIAVAGQAYASRATAVNRIRTFQQSAREAHIEDRSGDAPRRRQPAGAIHATRSGDGTGNGSAMRLQLTEAQRNTPIWKLIDEILPPVPPEERERVPHDGAENHDHYLYGAPKKAHG